MKKFAWIPLTIFLLLPGITMVAFAAPTIFFDPGTELMPNCAPGTCTVRISAASSSQSGLLSAGDWIVFSDKQNALGYVPYDASNPNGYISSSALASSTDVSFSGLTAGNFLKYNGASWVNTGLVAIDIPNLDMSKIASGNLNWTRVTSTPTTLASYGITDPVVNAFNGRSGTVTLNLMDVTTTLGYVPYSAANPANYIILASLSASTPLVYSTTTGAFSLPRASSTADGYLSSTDWSLFNAKQNALGYVPYNATNPSGYLSSSSISSSTDVIFGPLVSGNLLKYDGAKWINAGLISTDIPSLDMSKIATGSLGWSRVTSTPTTLSGYGITDLIVNTFNGRSGVVTLTTADVTTTLGYVPYSTTNPANYITLSALSASSPLLYSSSTGVLSLPRASSTANGYLSSADWGTFNNKENILTFNGPLTRATTTISCATCMVTTNNLSDLTSSSSARTNLLGGSTGLQYLNGLMQFVTPSTTNITEGANLYYTDARVRAALAAGTAIQYNSVSGVITNGGVQSLTGTANQINISTATGTPILSLPQNINTGASPTFTGMTLSGLTNGGILFATSSGVISQSNTLYWDNANSRLGIGTSTPAGKIGVELTTTGTDPSLSITHKDNRSVSTGNIPQALSVTYNDSSTGNRTSAQALRFTLNRNAGATGVPSAFDALGVFRASISDNAPYPIEGVRAEIMVASGTLSSYTGFYYSGKTGVGALTTENAFVSEQGNAIFNQNQSTSIFKVESHTEPNMLFVDGTNNRVGIGTSTPSSALHVIGKVTASAGFNGQCVSVGTFALALNNLCNQDVAESYATFELTEPGDVVAIPLSVSQQMDASSSVVQIGRSKGVAGETLLGVVSTNPGLVFRDGLTYLAGENDQLVSVTSTVVALAGRVPVKVSLENGPIQAGDELTASTDIPGVAVRAIRPGMVIGTALSAYTSGTEPADTSQPRISIFINPHWSLGNLTNSDDIAAGPSGPDQFTAYVQHAFHALGAAVVNGVMTLHELIAHKVTTHELCLDDVCVTKDQLQGLLQNDSVPSPAAQEATIPTGNDATGTQDGLSDQ